MQEPTESGASPDTLPFPTIRDIKATSPFRWLALAWDDLRACPVPSLFYGFCYAAMGLLITFVFEHAYQYTAGLTSGFLLLGPLLAMGLYEISRRRELGETCALAPTLTVWRRNISNLAIYTVVVGVIFLVWARASLVVFALFYTNELPNLSGFLEQILALENLEFLMVYFCVGLLFATIVFAVSVVAIPLMLDRNQDAITAMLASVGALAKNPATMMAWAFAIVGMSLLGFLTFHIGLVVAMPIIGHASWHAYRDLVAPLPRN
ncbi:DUF2189 domain-containing protein [Cognatazoarcus halotolerans]|uniref:DUF2189 domain-containing protein n=1 Tax=Cognatazoarcus halotolerans TaxID=2686016 RepID=UPI00135CB507|nr:DUF2189 domain-containing protein [Cognatazoarcus halotolerans]MBX3680028.1 DUF2189 domain-containing protein [Rhodocyclaceae bacterium]MCB1902058.1 DUF2189 domain-containing protein [Rhodocyclaceae bacterium]MCP5309506.1 DUF2189 domain-containing protein [Zoogloeaceae bacterium]